MLRQNEPYEQIETMANHGPLCKQIKSDKKASSNQPRGRDSENIIGAFLKSLSIHFLAHQISLSGYMVWYCLKGLF